MKLLLSGKNAQNLEELTKKLGFELVTKSPDIVISYGGDGTLLSAERQYPGIPKLPIRDSKVCKKCSNHTEEILLTSLANGKLELKEYDKMETEFEGIKFLALNDIVVRNTSAFHAIRLRIKINQKLIQEQLIIGDGIVASTPFGSTGYFQSITRKSFDKNFQIAFNNTIDEFKPIEFTLQDQIRIQIVRGPAQLTSDNNPKILELSDLNEISIFASEQKALIYSAESLRCPDCIVKRELRLN